MSKFKEYDVEEIDALCSLGKALSSPIRIEIMQLLYEEGMIIGDIAKKLDLPASSTAFHLKILEEAGLLRMEKQPGTRGTVKFCNRKVDYITVNLIKKNAEYCFYYPERMKAGILWTSSGYVKYKFANGVPRKRTIKKVSISMEVCSEAPGYQEDWKSDLTLWINDVEIGTWTCPGDFGARRGRLNPPTWPNGSTQYGMQVIWEVRSDGCYLNGERLSRVMVDDLHIMDHAFIDVKLGNKPGAKYEGGFNLFGKHYGDYNQDIVLTMEY